MELDLLDATDFSDKDFIKNLFETLKQHSSIEQVGLHISHMKSSDEKKLH